MVVEEFDELILPQGVHNYLELSEVPKELRKYWLQRNEFFSKYDQGIWMTDDLWFGVTPEPIANKIAEHVATVRRSETILIDAFAGAGGNTIAFARSGRWKQIFAVEKDPIALECAKHNAEIYGVGSKIYWIEGDVFEVLGRQLKGVAKKAVIFGSPPWGGPEYTQQKVFDLDIMPPYSLPRLYEAFVTQAQAKHVVLYLPRTSDLNQVAQLVEDNQKVEVMHYCMHGYSKALNVFFGNFNIQ